MTDPNGDFDFDFEVTPADAGTDEVQAAPTGAGGRPAPTRNRVIAAVVVAVLAGVIAVRAVAAHDGSSARRAAAPRPVASPATPLAIEAPSVPTGDAGGGLAACPDGSACEVVAAIPDDVLVAVLSDLPGVQIVDSTSVVELPSNHLRFRQISATYRGATVLIQVTSPAADQLGAQSEATTTGVRQMLVVAQPTGDGRLVQVQADGPIPSLPGLPALRTIAGDRRLLAAD